MEMTFKIIRFYARGGKRVLKRRQNYDQVRKHCQDPESCSTTCIQAKNVNRTKRLGDWFDGYVEE